MTLLNLNSSHAINLATAGTNTIVIGNAASYDVGAIAIQIVNTSSLSTSLVIKARCQTPEASAAVAPFLATVYRKLWLNGAAGDGSLVSTAITTDSLIIVPAAGLQIAIDQTYTSGSGFLYWTPCVGPSVI
jgi:hypothetical protein